jgi:hypothetical protein
MHWLFLLIAIGAFLVAFTTPSPAVLGISLIVALVLTVLWLMGLLAQRIGNTQSGEVLRLDPEELRRMREIAEARKAQSATGGDAPASTPSMVSDQPPR